MRVQIGAVSSSYPHDYLNSRWAYDASGNIRQGMSGLERGFGQALNATDVVVATPFAAAGSVPPETALSIGSTGLVVDHGKFIEETR